MTSPYAAPTAKDAILVMWSDGTDGYISIAATEDTNAAIATDDLVGFNLVKFAGTTSFADGDVHVNNITFVA